jgi:shikimate dehydrogenase
MQAIPRATILGKPVQHARSPRIHAFWLEKLGLSGEYQRNELEPGTVAAFLRGMQADGFVGGNITVPHKEEAFLACDRVSETARIARAVNTVWFEDGIICGDNTDGPGFVAHLDETYPGWDRNNPRILILGAGGAARGVVVPLLNRKIEKLIISNRSPKRAESLVADIKTLRPGALLETRVWPAGGPDLRDIDILINTTSLGMKGQPDLALDLAQLPPYAIVADIVYVPLETGLLRAATARGLRTLDGLGMLLHQAVPGFERWFGQKPVVTSELRAHILADLAGN